MDKKKIIEKLRNTYCRLKPSKINGVGVFAIRGVPKGTNPFKGIKGKWIKIKLNDLKNLDEEILKMVNDFFSPEKNGEIWIPQAGLNGMNISFFLNDSDKPNIYTSNGGLTFFTLRAIKKGEELCVSYKTFDDKSKKKINK